MEAYLNIDGYIDALPASQSDITQNLRLLIDKLVPAANARIAHHRPVWYLGSRLCYMVGAKAHVSLGFYRGTELPDPQGLLEGTGKILRHVKLTSLDELEQRREAISALIISAAELTT